MPEPNWSVLSSEGWHFKDSPDKLLAYFSSLTAKYPQYARAHFEYANALDYCGQESLAISHYQTALDQEIGQPYDFYTMIQLGSSYRNVGRCDDAVAILEQALIRKPKDASSVMFYSLALHSAGRGADALKAALTYILTNTAADGQLRYEEPLKRYIDDLTP